MDAVLRARECQKDGRIAKWVDDDEIVDKGCDEAFDHGLYLS